MPSSLVIGGGLAGLTSAFDLGRAGRDVTIIEAKGRLGGNVHTHREGPYRFEGGPHSWLPSHEAIFSLVDALGLSGQVRSADARAARRYIFRKGELQVLPMGPWSFLTSPILSASGKWFLMTEPLRTLRMPEDSSVDTWMRAHLGPEATERMVQPFVSGIYGGDARALCMAAAFPKFYRFEQQSGSFIRGALKFMLHKRRQGTSQAKTWGRGPFSFDEGMGTLTDALATKVRAKVLLDTPVTAPLVRKGRGWQVEFAGARHTFDHVVVATPAPAAAELLSVCHPELASGLSAVPYPKLAVVHLAVSRASLTRPLDGFGFLVPPVEGRKILGCIWVSSIFASRCPSDEALLAVFIGGATRPECFELPDDELIDLALEELTATCLKPATKPTFVRVQRHARAIPQYNVAHLALRRAIEAVMEADPSLSVVGNHVAGISAGDTVAWARRAVRHSTGQGDLREGQVHG